MNTTKWIRVAAGAAFLSGLAAAARAQCDDFTLTPSFYAAGSSPLSVATGDWNGDGVLDLALADPLDETVAILFGDGSGAFGPAIALQAGTAPRSIAAADLDGDGDMDLAVCNEGRLAGGAWQSFGMSVLRNDGSGGFSIASFSPLPATEIRPAALAVGDLDSDGDVDVAVALLGTGTMHSKVATFVNDGTGHFAAPLLASTGWGPVAIRLGDVDGDGVLDAVTVNTLADSMNVLHGNGDGSLTLAWGHASGTEPTDVALGDFDGDGRLDASVSYRYGLLVLRNVSGTLNYLANLAAGLFPEGVAFADLNGDGHLDLASVDYLGDRAFVWIGDGAGAFTAKPSIAIGNQPVGVVAADADGDADLDLFVPVGPPGGVSALRNDCPIGTYCAGKVNSQGCTPQIGWSGSPTVSGPDDFHVRATNELNHQSGIVFFGRAAASVPFAGGTRCVATPVVRTHVQGSGGNPGPPDCSGAYDFHATQTWFGQHGYLAGDELFAQFWSRDPQHPDGTGIALSDGLHFVVNP